MRTRAALVAAATWTGLLAAPTSTAVAAEICQGLPATVVAGPGTTVTSGTAGDDVIVGHEDANIDALGGNDVICLGSGQFDAGTGDDSVLVTGTDAESSVFGILGQGDDRFIGGPGNDFPEIGTGSPGADLISTAAGDDIVTSTDSDQPNRDIVDLGPGEDLLNLALPVGSSAQFQAGVGSDQLDFRDESADYVFDLGAGVVTRAGVQTALLAGFEEHSFRVAGSGALRVLGTPGADKLVVVAKRLDLQLGDGPDRVFVESIPVAGVLDLGAGKDAIQMSAKRLSVVDLVRGRWRLVNSSHRRGTLALRGAEDVDSGARRVVIRGGPGANHLSSVGCRIRLSGAGGADRLAADSGEQTSCGAVVTGGVGPDRLSGGAAADRLVGGAGDDYARGGPGTDTCSAETELACER